MRMLRERAVLDKMGMGRTSFKSKYIDTGRARWVRDGRIKRMPEHVVDGLIEEDIAASETAAPPPPAIPNRRPRRQAIAVAPQPAPRRRLQRQHPET